MDAEEAARASTDAVAYLPAGFMLDGATYKRGGELGFDGVDFYTAGRGGALGDVDGSVVAAAFVFFNPATIVERGSAPGRSWRVARRPQAFAGCLDAWAHEHLPDERRLRPPGRAARRINDAASPSARAAVRGVEGGARARAIPRRWPCTG